jgi:ferredoxin
MPRLKIDGREIEAAEGTTLLEAARAVGIEIPTLCYLKETGALTSCMICVVKEVSSGRLLPSCAVTAEDGMEIVTIDDEVKAARREVLIMLMNEHAGDCEGPCARICPAGLDVPRMLRHVAVENTDAAALLAKQDLIFPATLGWLCSAPCERVCRRAQYDAPLEIKETHRILGESPLELPVPVEKTGKSIAVAGAGLAGLAAAWTLAMKGHACHVYEKRDTACAALRLLPPEKLPQAVLDAEIDSVRRAGVVFHFGAPVEDVAVLLEGHDAAIVACNMNYLRDARVFQAIEEAMAVRAVGSGKNAALDADAWLHGKAAPSHRPFNSTLGNRLPPEELPDFSVERLQPSIKNGEDIAHDAVRCLHCDCLKPKSCKLRQYAEEYGLGPQIKRSMTRPPVSPIASFGEVLFEAGKCIKCGICVEMTRAAGLPSGMTMTGRGLESQLRTALGGTLEAGLGPLAEACVRACPTAALALCNREERE